MIRLEKCQLRAYQPEILENSSKVNVGIGPTNKQLTAAPCRGIPTSDDGTQRDSANISPYTLKDIVLADFFQPIYFSIFAARICFNLSATYCGSYRLIVVLNTKHLKVHV